MMSDEFENTLKELEAIPLTEKYHLSTGISFIYKNDPKRIAQAQKDFKANAKNLILDYNNFHLGWDPVLLEEVKAHGGSNQDGEYLLNDMFDDYGAWLRKSTYQFIKNNIVPLGNQALERAFKTCWGLMYSSDPTKLARTILEYGTIPGTKPQRPGPGNQNPNPTSTNSQAGGSDPWAGRTPIKVGLNNVDENTSLMLFDSATIQFLKFCLVDIDPTAAATPELCAKLCSRLTVHGDSDDMNTKMEAVSAFAAIRHNVQNKNYNKLFDINGALAKLERLQVGLAYKQSELRLNTIYFTAAIAIVMKETGWDLSNINWKVYLGENTTLALAMHQVGLI